MGYFLISYDISEDERRSKVADLLKDYGTRVQYSVFECRLDDEGLVKLLKKLKPFVGTTDSIRTYYICRNCLKKLTVLGKTALPEEPEFFVV